MANRRKVIREDELRYDLKLARSRLAKAVRDRNTRNKFLATYIADLESLKKQIEGINRTAGDYERARVREDDYIRKQKGIIDQIGIILKTKKEMTELRRKGRQHG